MIIYALSSEYVQVAKEPPPLKIPLFYANSLSVIV